jgi:hypothetical protein
LLNACQPARGISYEQKLARVLDAMGGLYLVSDILSAIEAGKMQSHVVNNSWAITEIGDYPRARKLHILAMVGDLADGEALHAKVLGFASDINAGLVSAYGRRGWIGEAKAHGWRLKARGFLYHKDC